MHQFLGSLKKFQKLKGKETLFKMSFDTLFDYEKLIKKDIAKAPKNEKRPPKVAIIGAGAAGLCAGYELLKIGIKPTIYEASDRIGGRAFSLNLEKDLPPFELGSMRVPASHIVFSTYAKRFGMKKNPDGFPNPGQVDTLIYFKGKSYTWKANEDPPGIFKGIGDDFGAWIGAEVEPIQEAYLKKDYSLVEELWQEKINQYKDTTFYEAVKLGIPKWGKLEMEAFGALGVGSGGFSSLFYVGFIELLRVIGNGMEEDQQMWLPSMESLPMGFYTSPPKKGFGSLKSLGLVKRNTPIKGVQYCKENKKPRVELGENKWVEYDSVIVSTTTCSMQQSMKLTESYDSGSLRAPITPPVKEGVRNLHMVPSSKLFIVTPTKFWKDPKLGLPSNIQTDESFRGLYCLDYGDEYKEGVVLASYTWEDDSNKLLASHDVPDLPDRVNWDRWTKLQRVIKSVAPDFEKHVKVKPGTKPVYVDWADEPYYYGGFKLNRPGQCASNQKAYYQFKTVNDPKTDKGVFIAGDGVSWAGGWTEGALRTGLNAACAVAKRSGYAVVSKSPLSEKYQPKDRYNYEGSGK